LFSSFSVLDVLVITVLELLVVLDLLLLGSGVLFGLFVGGVGDSLVEGGNFGFEVTNLGIDFLKLGIDLVSGGLVLINPMFVGSSFDFSGFGDLVQELFTDLDDLFDSLLVGLDWGGGGDLGE
jgi:hypothetical protein